MLSLAKIAAGPKAARYYTEQVAQGIDDYYSGEGEEPGRWTGFGIEAAGLSGEVDDERFAQLLAGGGLRKPPSEGGVAGFDLTFRAPKSVSVLWGVGSRELARGIRAAHDAAVAQALAYLEREACRARRGAGGAIQVTGRGFVGAAFMHRASRAGDPLLHTHVVIGNLTQGPDGRWTALDARHLYRHAKTAGYLYQAVLRRELTERLGLEWQPVERGSADVVGVTRAVIEHFSQRRAEILEHMREHGGRSAKAAELAALETRRAKEKVPVDRLRELWRSRAAEHGLDCEAVERISADCARNVVGGSVDPERLTEQASTFGRAELLQHLAEAHRHGANVNELERLADHILQKPQVVALGDRAAAAGVTERRYTTTGMLAVERELIDHALGRRYERVARVDDFGIDRALEGRGLSAEQRHIVFELCGDGAGVAVLRAPAGTGKTFVLDAAREAWERAGVGVVGCALSARAALELQDQAGIVSMTIAQLRDRLDGGGMLPSGGALVVDEAGMVGTRDLAALAHATDRSRTKLVLVGDDRQLPEIDAGGAFRALAERLGASELREVRRQVEGWDRAALGALRRGDVEQWARAYRERGRITIATRANDARQALVNDWHRAEGDKLMIAARRQDVRDLNDRARALLQADGKLGRDELITAGRAFAVGDRVVGQRNDRQLGILNGQRGTIEHIDTAQRAVRVALDNGKTATLPSGYLDAGNLDHAYAITAHRAQGATVDRAFVLGSDQLSREWGYTALSRHREEARFYITRRELDLDRDAAPEHDPIVSGLERILGRSKAKELALDQLAGIPTDQLGAERQQLHERFKDNPPPPTDPALEIGRDRAKEALDSATATRDRLQARRHQLGWFDRSGRRLLDQQLATNALEIDRRAETYEAAHRESTAVGEQRDAWITEHGADAQRLVAVDAELRSRQATGLQANRQLEQLARAADPLELSIEPPMRDLGMDIGMDL